MLPNPAPVIGLICQTVSDLQALAPVLALVLIGLALLGALVAGNALGGLFTTFGVLGAVGIAVFALVIVNLPSILGALGAGGACQGALSL